LWDRAPEKRKASDMTSEQREAAKAERQDVIGSNKAWDTAEPVRRQWLATFVTRKVAPKGAAAFLAHVLTEHSEVVHDMGGDHLAAEWFGLKPAAYGITSGWGKVIEQATEQRAQVIAVARLLSGLEKNTSRDSWRRVAPATALYMGTIAAWGYDLAEVEKRAAGLAPTKAAPRPRATAAPVPEQATTVTS
jgi:ParB family chromosome partitioning protein